MEKQKNIPALRFPEYTGVWECKKLGEITTKISDGLHSTPNYDEDGDYFFINGNNLINGSIVVNETTKRVSYDEYLKHKKDLDGSTILLSINGTIGSLALYQNEKIILGKSACYINLNTHTYKNYIYNLLQTSTIINFFTSELTGTTIKNLSLTTIKNCSLYLPTIQEQTKIATFLTAVDERLTQLKQKKNLLEHYKKGIVQKIFAQDIRFNPDHGDEFPEWEVKPLGVLAERMTVKNKAGNTNVLTISAQQGLVSQLEFFNKSVSAEDVSGYYLLKKDDFAYNKSYSNGYPMGAIKRLKYYEKGVVSTLYICFTFNDSVNLSFMEQYFESGIHNQEIEKVAQEGARNHGLLNIGLSDFFSTEIVLPCLAEQTKIANFLSAIDEKINCNTDQISKTEQYKKGLLQQMFV